MISRRSSLVSPSVIRRRIRENRCCGSPDSDDPDGKRNARAAMYSSEHEHLLGLQVSSCTNSYPAGRTPKLPSCGDLVAMS
jgi:hypothetical protein